MFYRLSILMAVLLTFLSFGSNYGYTAELSPQSLLKSSKVKDSPPLDLQKSSTNLLAQAPIGNEPSQEQQQRNFIPLWLLVGLILITVMVVFLIWLMLPAKTTKQETLGKTHQDDSLAKEKKDKIPSYQPKEISSPQKETTITKPSVPVAQPSVAIQTTTKLPANDNIYELIEALVDRSSNKRRRAIWELAQKADSPAVKPLVDRMMDADSQEKTLILEALSQVCGKTLKPINHALALSLQDENAQVRKNAIRDITRIYDHVSQIRPLLYHATTDENAEVREVAKWALSQLDLLQMPQESNLISEQTNDQPSSTDDAFDL